MTTPKPSYEELEAKIQELEKIVEDSRQTETALKESEQWFRTIFEGSKDAIFLTNEDSSFAYVNNAACELTGYSKEELLTMSIPDLHKSEDLGAFKNFFSKIMSGESILSEADILQKSGVKVPTEFSNKKIKVGNSHYMHTVARDISKRKSDENALIESKKLFQTVFNQSAVGVAQVFPSGLISMVNQQFCKITGYAEEELKRLSFKDITHQDDLKIEENIVNQVFAHEINFYEIEKRFIHKKGHVIYVRLFSNIVKDEDKNIKFALATVVDITDQKKAESALQKSEEKYRALYENAPLSYQSLDENGFILDVNPCWLRTLGYERQDIIGKNFGELLHPDWKTHFEENFPEFKINGYIHDVQFKIMHKTGRYVDVSFEGCIGYHPDGSFRQTYCVFKDITKQKEFEESLRQSEEKFRLIAENTSDGIIVIENEKITYVSPSYCIFGYSEEEIYSRDPEELWNLVHPVDREDVFKFIYGSINQQKDILTFRYRFRHKDGYYIWREDSAKFFYNANNELIKAYVVARDITDRKELEDDLKKTNEQFRLAVAGSQDGIWDWDIRSNYVYLSPRWKEQLGYKNDELVNHYSSFDGLLHPEDKPWVKDYILSYLNGDVNEYNLEFRLKHKNGTYRWIKAKGASLKDETGKPYRMAGSHTDVTDRKELEIKILKNRNLLLSIINSLPGLLNVVDSEYNIILVNEPRLNAGIEKYEDVKQVIGKKCFSVFMKRDAPCPWCKIKDVFKEKKMITDQTDPQDYREKYSGRALKIITAPIKDEANEVTGIIEYGVDVTELRNAATEAEASNRAKSEFLANMSHEIRTPLNGIFGMLQLLEMTQLNEEQQEYIETANKSTKRLNRLLTDILDLSRIETGKFEIRDEEFQISEVMQSIEDVFTQVATTNENNLKMVLEKNIPGTLRGDSTRLNQILFNLVGNACKYTQNGKVNIYASCLPVQDYDHCRILFTIEDDGKGIADNMLDHVFETFAQANDSNSPYARRYEGAGLGLPLVKRLVNLLGGNACVASEAGQGTTFYVSLPFKAPDQFVDKFSDQHHEKIYNYKQNKILLADDEPSTQIYIKRLLEKNGCKVIAVNDGEQALYELTRNEFDCVLMDIQMPVLDGVEATKKIRASKFKFKNIPIIALTAYAMTGDREKFLNTGMNDYISKPVDRNELLKVLNRNLSE